MDSGFTGESVTAATPRTTGITAATRTPGKETAERVSIIRPVAGAVPGRGSELVRVEPQRVPARSIPECFGGWQCAFPWRGELVAGSCVEVAAGALEHRETRGHTIPGRAEFSPFRRAGDDGRAPLVDIVDKPDGDSCPSGHLRSLGIVPSLIPFNTLVRLLRRATQIGQRPVAGAQRRLGIRKGTVGSRCRSSVAAPASRYRQRSEHCQQRRETPEREVVSSAADARNAGQVSTVLIARRAADSGPRRSHTEPRPPLIF